MWPDYIHKRNAIPCSINMNNRCLIKQSSCPIILFDASPENVHKLMENQGEMSKCQLYLTCFKCSYSMYTEIVFVFAVIIPSFNTGPEEISLQSDFNVSEAYMRLNGVQTNQVGTVFAKMCSSTAAQTGTTVWGTQRGNYVLIETHISFS